MLIEPGQLKSLGTDAFIVFSPGCNQSIVFSGLNDKTMKV